jgi:hypothetical protein
LKRNSTVLTRSKYFRKMKILGIVTSSIKLILELRTQGDGS